MQGKEKEQYQQHRFHGSEYTLFLRIPNIPANKNIRPGYAEKYLAVYAPGGIIWSTICGGGWRTHNPAAPKTDRRDYALYTQYYGKNI